MGKNDTDFKNAADIFLQARNEPLTAVMKNYFSLRYNEVVSLIDKRLNNALKTNEKDKIQSITNYKNQFLMAFGMNKNENQEITL